MCSLWLSSLALLGFSGQVLAPAGEELLQPPRNLTLMSEDFKLFLTWQPADDYPPGVSYTVKWRNPFIADWSTSHCVNISATSCDVTCVYPNPSNRFMVEVEALDRTGRTSQGASSDFIDYDDLVEPAPPVLQVRKAEGGLVVNTTFTYPPCVKSFFQDLAYNLEFWGNGIKRMNLSDVMETVVTIPTTVFSSSYCFRAQAFLPSRRTPSPFSEPVCGQLQAEVEEENDADGDGDDEDDEDDSGSPIPYTELRSPKKDLNCPRVGLGQITLNPSSEPNSSQSDGGCLVDVMVSKPFVSTELVTGNSASEIQDSRRTSLSGSSSAEEPLPFSVGYPATRGREDLNGDIDFSIPLSTLIGQGFSLPTETQFMAATDFPEGSWGNLEDTQIPLLRMPSHKEACQILEEQSEVERGFESASCGCGRHTEDLLLLKASSLEGAGNCTLGGNRNLEADSLPGPKKVHGYRSRQTLYISKTGLGRLTSS
ncbi:hypothetical protein lerEdw1_004972 [Lerista edwardsae]|nr:hypothetical protein lerEdw1_004972 [Lerista edwardsae]